jgi:hypothetical protein
MTPGTTFPGSFFEALRTVMCAVLTSRLYRSTQWNMELSSHISAFPLKRLPLRGSWTNDPAVRERLSKFFLTSLSNLSAVEDECSEMFEVGKFLQTCIRYLCIEE